MKKYIIQKIVNNLILVEEFKYIYIIYIEPMRIKYLQKLDSGYLDCETYKCYKKVNSYNSIEKKNRVKILSLKKFHNESQ